MGEVKAFELQTKVFADQRATGEGGDVAEHRLAAVAEAGGLGGAHIQHTPEFVDDQRRQGVAVEVFGNDQQRLARLRHLLQQRQEVAEVRDLLLVNQDQGVVELADHLGRLVDEVGRHEAFVELHAVDEPHGRLGGLSLLDRDHAVLTHLLQGLSQEVADCPVVVGTDRAHLGDLLGPLDLAGHLHQSLHGRGHTLLDPAANGRGVGAGGHVPGALAEDRPGQHRRRGGAVAGEIRRLRRHLVDQFGAHVLERVLEIDLLADGDAVLGHRRAAIRLVDDDITAGRTHGHGHGTGQFLHALQQFGAGTVVEHQLLGHGWVSSLCGKSFGFVVVNLAVTQAPPRAVPIGSETPGIPRRRSGGAGHEGPLRDQARTLARMSVSRRIFTSWPSTSMSLPEYLP